MKHYNNLVEAFREISSTYSDKVLYSQSLIAEHCITKDKHRRWVSTSYQGARERIDKIANHLASLGVTLGTKVAILSASRPEWLEADFAIMSAGGIVVSIYQSLPPKDIAYILFDSDSKIVFVENQEQLDKLVTIMASRYDFPATEDRSELNTAIDIAHIVSFENTTEHPLNVSLEQIFQMPLDKPIDTWQSVKRTDLASLVYTSGTTGAPKGVMQTHGNHLANVRQVLESGILPENCDIMLFLPLAHSFAKLIGLLGFLTSASLKFPGVADRHSSRLNQKSLAIDLAESNVHVVPVVPRILEKMKEAIEAKANENGLSNYLLRLTLMASTKNYSSSSCASHCNIVWKLLHCLLTSIRAKIQLSLFGSKLEYILSGGAKLNLEVAQFFDMLGIKIVEGYGLTETCVATNVNRPDKLKLGAVGPVLAPDIEIKIEPDGEICFRGPNVAVGYYARPTATKMSWDAEGWFHTGDLGSIDNENHLSIVGRKKEIIVTSYGKNIAPVPIEDRLKSSKYIDQAMLVGEGRAFCVAIVVINEKEVLQYARSKKMSLEDPLHDNPIVSELIWNDVEQINHSLPNHEKIRKIILAQDEFTIENEMLTPTFKIKRNAILKKYADRIEELYNA